MDEEVEESLAALKARLKAVEERLNAAAAELGPEDEEGAGGRGPPKAAATPPKVLSSARDLPMRGYA